MILYPNAKINIGLKVLNKRPDSFHNIETLFFPVEQLTDILEVVPSGKLTIEEYGIAFPGTPQENICIKAYEMIKADYDIPPVSVYLHKNIPVGAGLGGGSSDASHMIIALDSLFNLNLTYEKRVEYASRLGSDCPFFIYNKPMIGNGRGELLTPYPMPQLENYRIKLIHPPYFVSTATAYRGIKTRETKEAEGYEIPDKEMLTILLQEPVEKWKELIFNDFEESVFKVIPQLKEYKEALYKEGAIYAAMSGSGSTLFGIFRK